MNIIIILNKLKTFEIFINLNFLLSYNKIIQKQLIVINLFLDMILN